MVQGREENGKLVITITGTIDSSNATDNESELRALRAAHPCDAVELDCDKLEYSTSAGLRVILRLKQEVDDTVLTNVHPDLYNSFDITGFVDMMEIRKAYRVFSVDGCEVIGQGANGKVYRIDRDTIVKVYLNPDALPEIHRERELARLAFVAGVPTAIPYDVVRIEGGGYGSVFELLNATSFAKLLVRGEKTVDEVADMSIRLLKLIHSKEIRSEILPDMKAVALGWAEFLKDYLPEEQSSRLCALVEAVPEDQHLMHGDYHLKNIMLQNGESLLIDMDTLCHGHPIFELAAMYTAYLGFSSVDHNAVLRFLGLPREMSVELWRKSLELYLDTGDHSFSNSVQDKAAILSLVRIMRRTIRHGSQDNEADVSLIRYCRETIPALLARVDRLDF